MRILERAFARSPHPELAETYVHVRPGDAPRDRLRRARKLADLVPGDVEGALAVAGAAIAAREFDDAAATLAKLPGPMTERACLLMAELVAFERRSLGAILKELEKQTGEFHSDRLNLAIPPEKKEALLARLGEGFTQIGGLPVQQFIRTDGYKFLLPNYEWVAFRASGTEPLIRCYIEAKSAAQLEKLRKACRKLMDV